MASENKKEGSKEEAEMNKKVIALLIIAGLILAGFVPIWNGRNTYQVIYEWLKARSVKEEEGEKEDEEVC